jgi:type IV secretory pathway component VirB8
MMSNLNTVSMDSHVEARPKYFEVYGKDIANGNRAWFLAFLMSFVALAAVVFAVLVKTQPPTVIRIAPDGEATVVGRPAKGSALTAADAGADPFLNQAFLKRFLRTYLNYAPANVDDRWATSLNMMTRNLRAETYKQMKDDNAFGKVVDDQIQSVFHLREITSVPGEPLTFVVYGVKDVHHVSDGTETTDHFVNEYRIRLVTDTRSEVNPDGLWIAQYSERAIDGERRSQVLATPDQEDAHE